MIRHRCISDPGLEKKMVALVMLEKEGKLSVIVSLVSTVALDF